jgi:pyruvate ferredoxin oxidoreductase alpha subunit
MKNKKKTFEILDGNASAATGARLSGIECFPCFPITPQTEIIELFAKWKAEGIWTGELKALESEHSVLSCAIASELTEARTFTATSSQGLLLMHEMLSVASGVRAPLVMVNVSRAISAPITLWCDHNDFLGCRDAGWLMFSCETNQEVLDTVIMAYRISESVMLPSLVNMDGFIHSYTREEVKIPKEEMVRKFLPKLKMKKKIDINEPQAFGVPAMPEYSYFRSQMHRAQLEAKKIIEKTHRQWKKLTGRKYELTEPFMMEGAKIGVVCMGANSSVVRSAVESLRKKKIKTGFLKLRTLRPFPSEQIKKHFSGVDKILVIDQNSAPGSGGILHPEISSAAGKPASSLIAGLGGKPVSQKEYELLIKKALESKPYRKWVV